VVQGLRTLFPFIRRSPSLLGVMFLPSVPRFTEAPSAELFLGTPVGTENSTFPLFLCRQALLLAPPIVVLLLGVCFGFGYPPTHPPTLPNFGVVHLRIKRASRVLPKPLSFDLSLLFVLVSTPALSPEQDNPPLLPFIAVTFPLRSFSRYSRRAVDDLPFSLFHDRWMTSLFSLG